jgi:hypothetical protein
MRLFPSTFRLGVAMMACPSPERVTIRGSPVLLQSLSLSLSLWLTYPAIVSKLLCKCNYIEISFFSFPNDVLVTYTPHPPSPSPSPSLSPFPVLANAPRSKTKNTLSHSSPPPHPLPGRKSKKRYKKLSFSLRLFLSRSCRPLYKCNKRIKNPHKKKTGKREGEGAEGFKFCILQNTTANYPSPSIPPAQRNAMHATQHKTKAHFQRPRGEKEKGPPQGRTK